MKNTKINEIKLYELFNRIFEQIHFINEKLISIENRKTAYELCKDVDEDDTPFIALALEIDAFLWTGDKKLKKHLIEKNFKDFFNII